MAWCTGRLDLFVSQIHNDRYPAKKTVRVSRIIVDPATRWPCFYLCFMSLRRRQQRLRIQKLSISYCNMIVILTTILTRTVGQTDLIFDVRSGFISIVCSCKITSNGSRKPPVYSALFIDRDNLSRQSYRCEYVDLSNAISLNPDNIPRATSITCHGQTIVVDK